jgi:DNA-directed RNA polymerase specialized sigma subunit
MTMENIFDKITNLIPKPKEEDVQRLQELEHPELAPQKNELKSVVARWQKDPKPDDTKFILQELKPTINSAMTSYAPGMDKSLAVKAANLALDAMRTYKPDFGTDPKTHAFHTLKRLNRYAMQRNNIMPQSEGTYSDEKKLQQVQLEFEDQYGREATIGELADITGWNTRKVDRLLNGNIVLNDSSTLSDESRKDTQTSSDVTDEDYFEYVYASVGPIDQKIMEWTSGLHGKPALPNNQIAQRLHITPAAVSQRKAKIQQLMSDVRGLV